MEPSVKKITAASKHQKSGEEKLDQRRQSEVKRLSLKSQQQLSSLQERILHPDERDNVDSNTIPIRTELVTEVEGLISALEW